MLAPLTETETSVLAGQLASPTDWWGEARCNDLAGTMNGLFFSEELQDIARAKAICAKCPVIAECLEGALERRSRGACGAVSSSSTGRSSPASVVEGGRRRCPAPRTSCRTCRSRCTCRTDCAPPAHVGRGNDDVTVIPPSLRRDMPAPARRGRGKRQRRANSTYQRTGRERGRVEKTARPPYGCDGSCCPGRVRGGTGVVAWSGDTETQARPSTRRTPSSTARRQRARLPGSAGRHQLLLLDVSPCVSEMPALEKIHRTRRRRHLPRPRRRGHRGARPAFLQSVGVTWNLGLDPAPRSCRASAAGHADDRAARRRGKVVDEHRPARTRTTCAPTPRPRLHDMIDVNLALAFTTGMVARSTRAGSPCCRPTCLSSSGWKTVTIRSSGQRVGGLLVGLAVTIGFAATFAVVGLLVNRVTCSVYDVAPWTPFFIGTALVGLGIAPLAGYEMTRASAPPRQGRPYSRPRFHVAVRGVLCGRLDRGESLVPRGHVGRVRQEPRVGRRLLRRLRVRLRRRPDRFHRRYRLGEESSCIVLGGAAFRQRIVAACSCSGAYVAW